MPSNQSTISSFSEAAHSTILYGVSLAQDIAFDLTPYTVRHTPLSFRFRLQGFDAREWANRIYTYEHDVLYAFSIPATYGLGGRAYLCLRWQIIPQLALYFRVSETIYARDWYIQKYPFFDMCKYFSTLWKLFYGKIIYARSYNFIPVTV